MKYIGGAKMGQNVNLTQFGMCAIRCKKCGKDLDLSEVDIDCDMNTNESMTFELNLNCYECEEQTENEIKFRIIREE